ncbi:hypothetical protein LTR78_010377 [Recurvomyces mirabilis]|uniref:Pisatin demethylase n=1 Tax=Recurvomyces mirabilis TaxID=574656 RepID=A0AAE0TMF7_9PEZI|nr:hypothetical protein LTR78_010377 [Recurvomyces mirabilis]KAK5150111.1 hypothetical protein LTS14_010374 [Recurvomyces mirabilis]
MLIQTVLLGILGLFALRLLVLLNSALSPHPGPFWARWSKAWYFIRVWRGSFERENVALHQQYGPVVRIAPDWYSIDDPSVVKKIYGLGTKFTKTAWYNAFAPPRSWHLFADRDEKRHAGERRKYQAMYSMTSMVHYETLVDECAALFVKRLDECAKGQEEIDMGHWFQCYAFDVIGNITYSKRFGFLDHGKDVNGVIAGLQHGLVYGSLVGIYARLHPMLFRLIKLLAGRERRGFAHVSQFTQVSIDERQRIKQTLKDESERIHKELMQERQRPLDFLDKILQAHIEDPGRVTPFDIMAVCQNNVVAGSDTTSITLSAILYHLLGNVEALRKLQEEIFEHECNGRCGKPFVTFKESQEMPYLQAVIKEALRMHSATGLPLWRDVPEGGLECSGWFIRPGSVVGINAWSAHYNQNIFGHDANEFKPERWINRDKEGLRAMEAYWMPFGFGARTCLGRHISMLEISKLIPQLIRDFDFGLVKSGKQWETRNAWFVKPVNFMVRVKSRNNKCAE